MGIRDSGNLVHGKAMISFRQFVNVTSLNICLSYFDQFRFPQKCIVTIRYSAAWWCKIIWKLFFSYLNVPKRISWCAYKDMLRMILFRSRCDTKPIFDLWCLLCQCFVSQPILAEKMANENICIQFFSISNFCAGVWLNPGFFYKEHILINNQIRRTFHWRKRF